MAGSNLFVGTLELLLLQAVRHQALHGYAVGLSLRERTDGVLDIGEGALYPALHRLEAKDLVKAKWGQSESGRQAKFYSLTANGRRHLSKEQARWKEHAQAVNSVLQETS